MLIRLSTQLKQSSGVLVFPQPRDAEHYAVVAVKYLFGTQATQFDYST